MSCERDTDGDGHCANRDCQRFGCLVQLLSDNRDVVRDFGEGWKLVGHPADMPGSGMDQDCEHDAACVCTPPCDAR